MAEETTPQRLRFLTAEIVGSCRRHHQAPVEELPAFIAAVHRALGGLGRPKPVEEPWKSLAGRPPVRRSVARARDLP